MTSLLHFNALQANGGAAGAPAGDNANNYAAPAAGGDNSYSHLPPLQRKIMEIVSADSSGEGMHVKHVGRMCGASNGEEVMEAIELLMGEGLLYSTIDDLVSVELHTPQTQLTVSTSLPPRNISAVAMSRVS